MKIVIEMEWTARTKRILRGTLALVALGLVFSAAVPIDTTWIRPGQPVSASLLKSNLDDLQSQIIVQDTVINVSNTEIPTLQAAWASLQRKVIRARVTIRIANGIYALPAGSLRLNHPDGTLISIIGNTTTPGSVIINAVDDGLIVDEGSTLGLINGIRLVGPASAPSYGFSVSDRAGLTVGPNISVSGFDLPFLVARKSLLNFRGGDVAGTTTNDCILVDTGSHVDVTTINASNCGVVFDLERSSSGLLRGGTATNVYGVLWATRGSSGTTDRFTFSLTSGGVAWRAALGSVLFVNQVNLGPYSPAPGVVGNNNSIIGQ